MLAFSFGVVPGLPAPAAAQDPPDTDIWILPLGPSGTSVDQSRIVKATNRPGYDNQPHFIPGDRGILYTSVDSTGQADIWIYDLESGRRENLTNTSPESEYSPTVMPSLTRFSVIRVEADSAQRLWSFDSAGGRPALVLEAVAPVGYHTWLDESRLGLFVLGSPATLQIASLETGRAEVVTEDIGRSLHTVPGRSSVSYVQWVGPGQGTICSYDPDTGETLELAPVLEGNEYFAWTPDGVLIMGSGAKLFRFAPSSSSDWEEIADLEAVGIQAISRVAVSRAGDRIAIVVEPNPH